MNDNQHPLDVFGCLGDVPGITSQQPASFATMPTAPVAVQPPNRFVEAPAAPRFQQPEPLRMIPTVTLGPCVSRDGSTSVVPDAWSFVLADGTVVTGADLIMRNYLPDGIESSIRSCTYTVQPGETWQGLADVYMPGVAPPAGMPTPGQQVTFSGAQCAVAIAQLRRVLSGECLPVKVTAGAVKGWADWLKQLAKLFPHGSGSRPALPPSKLPVPISTAEGMFHPYIPAGYMNAGQGEGKWVWTCVAGKPGQCMIGTPPIGAPGTPGVHPGITPGSKQEWVWLPKPPPNVINPGPYAFMPIAPHLPPSTTAPQAPHPGPSCPPLSTWDPNRGCMACKLGEQYDPKDGTCHWCGNRRYDQATGQCIFEIPGTGHEYDPCPPGYVMEIDDPIAHAAHCRQCTVVEAVPAVGELPLNPLYKKNCGQIAPIIGSGSQCPPGAVLWDGQCQCLPGWTFDIKGGCVSPEEWAQCPPGEQQYVNAKTGRPDCTPIAPPPPQTAHSGTCTQGTQYTDQRGYHCCLVNGFLECVPIPAIAVPPAPPPPPAPSDCSKNGPGWCYATHGGYPASYGCFPWGAPDGLGYCKGSP